MARNASCMQNIGSCKKGKSCELHWPFSLPGISFGAQLSTLTKRGGANLFMLGATQFLVPAGFSMYAIPAHDHKETTPFATQGTTTGCPAGGQLSATGVCNRVQCGARKRLPGTTELTLGETLSPNRNLSGLHILDTTLLENRITINKTKIKPFKPK